MRKSKSQQTFINKIKELCNKWIAVDPNITIKNGEGKPINVESDGFAGEYIEALLGYKRNNSKYSDTKDFELKTSTSRVKTGSVTLFSVNPYDLPVSELLNKFGIDEKLTCILNDTNKYGLSYKLNGNNKYIDVTHNGVNVSKFFINTILNTAIKKLDNLILIKYEFSQNKTHIRFNEIFVFYSFDGRKFIDDMRQKKNIKISLRANKTKTGKVRDRGTKFHMSSKNLPEYYNDYEIIN